MRQTVALFLSFSLTIPTAVLAYDDYSRYERGPDSYSFNNSQETWKRNFNFRESFNYNAPLTRAPIQFPKVSLDSTFQNTFRSFSSFNAPNFARKLDLNYKSFASSSFPVNPVVQTYNSKSAGTSVLEITQSKAPIGFFSGVANAVKAIPAFFSTVGNKIGEAASFLWNRVVLGHRTENTATLPDGTRLTGQITLNRSDKILSIAPGTIRTVGEFKQLESGEMALVPAKSPVTINDNNYLSGQFVYDGEKFQLDGPGIKLTNQAGPTIQTTAPFKEFVNGDAQGNETILGYGALSRNDTFRETSTGLSFRNTNGVWSFDPNQSAVLKVDGKNIPVAIDEQGRFKETVKSPTAEPTAYITNVLPNPGTSGYEIEKVTQLTGNQTIRTEMPGTKPSSLTTAQANDWRQKTGAMIEVKGQRSDSATNATVHQEGDQYVFTSGQVATVSVSAPKDSPQEGQKTLYTEAQFGSGTRLTVTGKTEFPNYGTTVYVGKVTMGGSGKLNMEKGTIFVSEDRGLRLTVQLNGGETAIAVKSIDDQAGTFVALLPDIPLKSGEYVRPVTREVKGRIDAENGQAILTNTAVRGPILIPRETPGFWEAGPEVTGNGYIQLKDNKITLNTDRLVNLSGYKNLDERKPVWTTTMSDRYATALGAFADPDNNLIIRSGGLVLATAMVVPKAVEETVAFVAECVHPAREFVVHSFLVAHEKDPVAKLRAAGKAADNFGEFFIRAEAGATAAVTGGALVVREGTPIIRNAARSVSNFFEKPTTLAPQPARSLGAAARADLADPLTTQFEFVRREQPASKPVVAMPPPSLKGKHENPLTTTFPQDRKLSLETGKAFSLKRITQQSIHGVKGVVSEAPPLIPEIAKTFENQVYTPIKIQETLTVYRAEGARFGRWFGLEKPDSAGVAERLYNIVDFGNDVMEVSAYQVPKGSVVYIGKVAGGEGHQVFIPYPKKVGVSLKGTEHLPQVGH